MLSSSIAGTGYNRSSSPGRSTAALRGLSKERIADLGSKRTRSPSPIRAGLGTMRSSSPTQPAGVGTMRSSSPRRLPTSTTNFSSSPIQPAGVGTMRSSSPPRITTTNFSSTLFDRPSTYSTTTTASTYSNRPFPTSSITATRPASLASSLIVPTTPPRDTISKSPRESLLSTPISSTIGSTRAVSPTPPPPASPRVSPLNSPQSVVPPAPGPASEPAAVATPVVDEIVNARGGQRLKFTTDVVEIINKKRCCCRKKDYEIKYSDIQSTVVEWYCFSGALVIKTSDDTHRFRFGKAKLMQAASALRRRREKPVGQQQDAVAKVRSLLFRSRRVGVTNTGLITKKKKSCCSCMSTAVYTPWTSIVAVRMTRTCCKGKITITAKIDEDVQGGAKGFGKDTSETTIAIKGRCCGKEALYEPLTAIMSQNFSHMEELKGMKNKRGHIKATQAGLFLDSGKTCCGGFDKSFIPWGSMVAMMYRHRSCCKKAALMIQDRLQAPVNVGSLDFTDFEEVRKIFSKTVAEGPARASGESDAPGRGLTLNQEGMHYKRKYCSMNQLFSPWAKIDGLMLNMGTCGCSGNIHLITEAGHDFKIFKSRKIDALWEKFDEIRKYKYGASDAGSNKLCFNQDEKDDRKTCVLTDQSLRLSLKKGKKIQEIDLERVIGARAVKRGKSAIDVALNVGRGKKKCAMLRIKIQGIEAEKLAEDIRDRSTKRKNDLKKITGLQA